MKIKLHDKNTSIVDLSLVIFVEKGEESIFIQYEHHSFELDYSDLVDDIEEVAIIDKDYQIITDCITQDVEKLKEVNEVLEKNLENAKMAYEKLFRDYDNLRRKANMDWVRADDRKEQIEKAIKYIQNHKILKKKELIKILN